MRPPKLRHIALPGLAVIVAATVGVVVNDANAATVPSAAALARRPPASAAGDGWASAGPGPPAGARPTTRTSSSCGTGPS